jgi:putative transposase
VDVFSREALAIEVGQRLRAENVVAVCNRLAARRGGPKCVLVDNGSECSGRLLDLWAYRHGVQIDFSRPGKATDNCFIETFNGALRDECPNVHWFGSMEGAKEKIEAWRRDYNESGPHQALHEQTPAEFVARANELDVLPSRRKLALGLVRRTQAAQFCRKRTLESVRIPQRGQGVGPNFDRALERGRKAMRRCIAPPEVSLRTS